MNVLGKLFLKGLAVVIPVTLTLAILWWMARGAEEILGGLLMLTVGLGPYHARAPRLELAAVFTAWTNRRIRYAILGYVGHMWELYAFWAWVGVIAGTSFAASGADPDGSLA